MNRKRLAFIFLLIQSTLMSSAQKTVTASGSYTYYAPTGITLDQARSIALERAKNQIIADHFGTIVGVTNSSVVSNSGDESSSRFLSIGESEVRGEWLETIGKPVFDVSYEKNMQVVKVTVKGTVRELKTVRIPFKSAILRNGTSDRDESDEFRQDDDLFVSFESPVDGYVAIFLFDGEDINRLLPLRNQNEGSIRVCSGERYVFFEQRLTQYSVSEDKTVEYCRSIYKLTCDGTGSELNRIYLVFSPHFFSRAADDIPEDPSMPAGMTFESFQKWLSKSRKQDLDMSVAIKDILIRQ